MRQADRGGCRTFSLPVSWLVCASLLLAAVSVRADDCYPKGAKLQGGSNNRPVFPDRSVSQMPDAWGDPGAAPVSGKFPCTSRAECTLSQVMNEAHACALLVIKKGRLVYEWYESANKNCREGPDLVPNGRSKLYGLASITKSVVSTLFGHVVADPGQFGAISLDDPVSLHVGGLPEDSHIRQVTIRQALTMTSALQYQEYSNCLKKWTADNAQPSGKTLLEGVSSYKNRNPHQVPGKDFQYAGLNTALVGLTVESMLAKGVSGDVTHLNDALSAWIWSRAGMREQARWKGDKVGTPLPYCCLYATARDLGRFGQYVLSNWMSAEPGNASLHDWLVEAVAPQVSPPTRACNVRGKKVRLGYGYQWWTLSGAEGFAAMGIDGQYLHILPDQEIVIVQFGSWQESRPKGGPWPSSSECDVHAAHRFLADRPWQ